MNEIVIVLQFDGSTDDAFDVAESLLDNGEVQALFEERNCAIEITQALVDTARLPWVVQRNAIGREWTRFAAFADEDVAHRFASSCNADTTGASYRVWAP